MVRVACLPLVALVLAAVPVDSPRPTTECPLDEAQQFTQQLLQVAEDIQREYIREVSLPTLVEAGLKAVYQAARETLPPTFAADLARAGKNPDELFKLTVQIRQQAGNGENLRGQLAILNALNGLVKVLDPYCGVVNGQAFVGRGDDNNRGVGFDLYHGDTGGPLGVLPGSVEPKATAPPIGPWRVQYVTPGSPAQTGGLRPGDRVTHVNGHAAGTPEAIAAITVILQWTPGNPATPDRPVVLAVRREGKDKPVELKIEPGSYTTESVFGVSRNTDRTWNYWADRPRKLGYIRIGPIGTSTPEQFQRALDSLILDDARGVVVDLRYCPGGYLMQATDLTRLLLPTGDIASVSNRVGETTSTFRADNPRIRGRELPLVILIGPETSGGGELLAAALQDNKRAVICGQRSLGKASVQSQLQRGLPGLGFGFKLTSGFFHRPSKKPLHRQVDARLSDDWGVRPDPRCELPASPEMGQRLKHWWELQTLRPAGSREALPLDDPLADPQQQGAMRILNRLIREAKVPAEPLSRIQAGERGAQ